MKKTISILISVKIANNEYKYRKKAKATNTCILRDKTVQGTVLAVRLEN